MGRTLTPRGNPGRLDRSDVPRLPVHQGGSAAAQYASAVSTPGNALYGKFLTPEQYRAKFSPTSTDVSTVASWLAQEGFTVGAVPDNRKYVEATGTLDQAAKAFGTSFGEYKVGTRTVRSNTTPLSIPDSLSAVEGVIGLDQSQTLAKHYSSPPPVFVNGRPCSAYWGEKTVQDAPALDGTALPSSPTAWAPCGYAGAQLQGAYGVTHAIGAGNDGSGVTVGVIDAYASSTIESDVEKYSSLHGLPSIKGNVTQVVPPGRTTCPRARSRTRRAGAVRRRSTSRRSTPRLPARTSSTSAHPTTSRTSTPS